MCIEFFQQFSGGITAISALISAITTVIIAYLNHQLAKENKILRKAGTEPHVVAYMMPSPNGDGYINFVLQNVGRGPAFDLGYTIECDENDFLDHNVMLTNDPHRTPINVLPQDDKLSVHLGEAYILGGDEKELKPLKPFVVTLEYKNNQNVKYSHDYTINIAQFFGLRGIFENPELPKSINNLADKIIGLSLSVSALNHSVSYQK